MAKFIEVSRPNGDQITINVEMIAAILTIGGGGCMIRVAGIDGGYQGGYQVQEGYQEVLRLVRDEPD
jgi:hypothetical protein